MGALGAVRVSSRRTRRATRAPVRRSRPYTLSGGARGDVNTGRPAPRPRPKPKPKKRYILPTHGRQPGPYSNRERRQTRRQRRTKQHRRAIVAARRSRLRHQARGHPVARVQPGPYTAAERTQNRKATYRPVKFKMVQNVKTGERSYNVTRRVPRADMPLGRLRRDQASRRFWAAQHARRDRSLLRTVAPAIKVLEQTARPIHAVAGGARAAIRGENVAKAAGRGARLKDRYLFSDVLKEAGAPKWLQVTGGLALDFAADPTTRLTFGTSAAARRVGQRAIKRAEKQARKRGLSADDARRVAPTVARANAKRNRGITVGLRSMGREVKTSGRATAAVSRTVGVSRTAKRAKESRPVQVVGQAMLPGFRPKGVPKGQWERVRRAQRTARAMSNTGQKNAQSRAVAYFRALKGEDQAKIINAVETGSSKGLSAKGREVAQFIRRDLDQLHQAERGANLVGEALPNYFPHKLKSKLLPGGGAKGLSASKKAALESSKRRGKKDTLEALKRQGYTEFADDIPLVMGARMAQSAVARGNAHLLRELARSGHRKLGHLADGEAVYKMSARELPRRLSERERRKLLDEIREKGYRDATRGDDYRVLNEELVTKATTGLVTKEGTLRELGRFWDRQLQGKWKTLVTVPNPQYHATNLYGDLWLAYLADTSGRSLAQAGRALGRDVKRQAAKKTLGKVLDPKGRGIKIGGKRYSYDELLEAAEKYGAIRTGFIGRDLPDVLDAMAKEGAEKVGQGRFAKRLGKRGRRLAASRTGRVVGHPIDTIRAASEYRENFPRFATFLQALKRGKSFEEAAEWSATRHIDYGDLTTFEQSVLRRILPFYTFTARNTPLQVKTLVQRPGKFANLEKVRAEGRGAAGLPPGYEENLEPYEQRGLPIPTPLKDAAGDPLNLYPKLPAMDLNRITTDPEEQAQLFLQMVSPLLKVPLETGVNYNTFFREHIDPVSEESGGKEQLLVPAPGFVRHLPGPVKRRLGIGRIKKEGKSMWGWPAKLQYLVGQGGPLAATATQLATPAPRNRRGQTDAMRLLGWGTGLKLAPYNPKQIEINQLYDNRSRWNARADKMRKEGNAYTKGGGYTKEYRQVLDRAAAAQKRIERLEGKKPTRTPVRKRNPWGSGSGWGGTQKAPAGGGWGPGAGWGR